MKIGFYSCMSGVPWGGSEELWWRAAQRLQEENHQVAVNYKWWPYPAKQLQQLAQKGGAVHFRNPPPAGFWKSQYQMATRWFARRNGSPGSWLDQVQPDCVLITIGYHPDRVEIAKYCSERNIPYAINVQCASNFFFIHGDHLESYRDWYRNAKKVYFVSAENQHKLETNLATQLTNSDIVCNPFNIDLEAIPDYPNDRETFRLACVGRIHFQSKGQDLIVDVMKRPKWRQRNIQISFCGSDQGNKRQLEELVRLHGLQNQLKFAGFVENVNQIWASHHGLLLPSRYEGAPLCVVEAMLCNRLCITSDTGRNVELMDDNVSGFIARGATADLLDEAMERAWQQRQHWKQIGGRAGRHVRQRFSIDPVREFVEKLKQLAD